MKRRILAGLLSLVMVMSLLPGAALAAEETAEPDVPTAPVEPEEPAEEPGVPMEELTPAEPVEKDDTDITLTAEQDVWGGNYDTETAFEVSSKEDLVAFAALVNSGKDFSGKTVTLTGNVDLTNVTWTPIGTNGKPFKGTFDGKGNTISKLIINESNATYQGLFGFCKDATLRNVNITDAGINCDYRAGILAGVVENSTIQDVTITNSNIAGRGHIGGLIGRVQGSNMTTSVSGCDITDTNISAMSSATSWDDTTSDSVDSASPFETRCGGITSITVNSTLNIENCNLTNVKVKSYGRAGGILGFAHQSAQTSIEHTTFNGSVFSKSGLAAGLATSGSISAISVKNCKVAATLESTSPGGTYLEYPFVPSGNIKNSTADIKFTNHGVLFPAGTAENCTVTAVFVNETATGIDRNFYGFNQHRDSDFHYTNCTGTVTLPISDKIPYLAASQAIGGVSGETTYTNCSLTVNFPTEKEECKVYRSHHQLGTSSVLYVDFNKENVTITHDGEYSKDESSAIGVLNGGSIDPTSTEGAGSAFITPVKEGYIFAGWYNNKEFTGDPATTSVKGKTYYAKWIELTAADLTMTYGDEKPLSEITVAGLTLDNWASDNEDVVRIDKAAGKLIATGVGETTITANASLTKSGEKLKVTVTVSQKAIDDATAAATGTYTYTGAAITPTVTVKMGEKTLTENDYTVTASNNTNAGTANFTVTGKGNYEGTVTGTFTIAPATLTVTADDKTMVVGGTVPALTHTVKGLKGKDKLTNDPILSCDADGTQIGSFTITISGAAAGDNYTVTHVNGTLTVTEKADVSGQMTVTAPASLVYDGAAKAYTAACAGISQWIYTYKDAQGKILEAAPVNAGAYTVTISGTGDASFAQKTVNFTIEKAPLTIQAKDQTIRAGKDLPEFTYTVTGLVNGEKLAKEPTLTCDTDGKTPGEYPIVPSNADAGNNYEISYVAGTLTVTKRASSGGSSADKEYSVSVDDGKNGAVSISPKRAEKGDTVTITVKPDKGYELDELIVTDSKGREIDLREKGDNKFTFKMPGSKVTVEATFRAVEETPEVPQLVNPFVDVNENAYYHDAVLWAVEKGITGGTSAATFSPDDACTRAQMVTFLWRAAGSPVVNYAMSFTDVPADAYYAEAVRWAVSQGITAGTSATTFSPNATVTRGQTVTFLWRAAGSPVVAGDSFADVAADAYYAPAVAWAVREGITAGIGAETFAPSADCTRGQIVTFLYRDMAK